MIQPIPNHIIGKDDAPMVLIPAGEFQMGSNDGPDTRPVHTVYLDAFYMDVYLVTNALYKKFVDATGYHKPFQWQYAEWQPGFDAPDQPVVTVSWEDAMAYCEWAGKRLPTEAEWEKAARGGLAGKFYPWGDDEPDQTKANFGNNVAHTTRVGMYPANGYGLYDMAGNVWEWCADWYGWNYYANSPKHNPKGPALEECDGYRVVRGGSWEGDSTGHHSIFLRTHDRRWARPTFIDNSIGFRCVQFCLSKIRPQ